MAEFDPNQPFETAPETEFDPSQPFETENENAGQVTVANTPPPEQSRLQLILDAARRFGIGAMAAAPFKEEISGVVDSIGQPGNFTENYYKNRDSASDFWDRKRAAGGTAGKVGEIVGSIPAVIATSALPGGIAATGALAGLDRSEGRLSDIAHGDFTGIPADIGMGAAESIAADKALRVAGSGAKAAMDSKYLKAPVGAAQETTGKALQLPQRAYEALAEKIGGLGMVKKTVAPTESSLPSAVVQDLKNQESSSIAQSAAAKAEAEARVAQRDAAMRARNQAQKEADAYAQAERAAAERQELDIARSRTEDMPTNAGARPGAFRFPEGQTVVSGPNTDILKAKAAAMKALQESASRKDSLRNQVAQINDEILAKKGKVGIEPDVNIPRQRLDAIGRGRAVLGTTLPALSGGIGAGPAGAMAGAVIGKQLPNTAAVDIAGAVGQKLEQTGKDKILAATTNPNFIQQMAGRDDMIGRMAKWVISNPSDAAGVAARSYILQQQPAFRSALAERQEQEDQK